MQRHWLVTLQKISSAGRHWDADVPKALLQDELCGSVNVLTDLVDDVHWQLSLQRYGKAFRLSGSWQAKLARSCSRCNADFAWQTSSSTERLFQLGKRPEVQTDDNENEQACDYIDKPGEMNLLDVLREDVWLAWKADVICSASCQGLCQGCGVNLNTNSCQCQQDDSDHPFAALRGLSLED